MKMMYLGKEYLLPFASENVWKATNDCLIANDIIEADTVHHQSDPLVWLVLIRSKRKS